MTSSVGKRRSNSSINDVVGRQVERTANGVKVEGVSWPVTRRRRHRRVTQLTRRRRRPMMIADVERRTGATIVAAVRYLKVTSEFKFSRQILTDVMMVAEVAVGKRPRVSLSGTQQTTQPRL